MDYLIQYQCKDLSVVTAVITEDCMEHAIIVFAETYAYEEILSVILM